MQTARKVRKTPSEPDHNPNLFAEVQIMAVPEFTIEDLENEEWRPVVGREAYYAVSNLGRIKKLFCTSSGFSRAAGSMLQTHRRIRAEGYPRVRLCYPQNQKPQVLGVHIVVAAAFIGPRPLGMHINHIDGIKENSRATNLEYVTPKENVRHAMKIGLFKPGTYAHVHVKGESHPHAKLTTESVLEIRRRLKNGEKGSALAREMKVSRMQIHNIKNRRNWAHV